MTTFKIHTLKIPNISETPYFSVSMTTGGNTENTRNFGLYFPSYETAENFITRRVAYLKRRHFVVENSGKIVYRGTRDECRMLCGKEEEWLVRRSH